MAIQITTPYLGTSKKAAKDLVISILTFDYPLTIAKITNGIKKKFNASVTFQGVRKAVNILLDDGVLEKDGKNYSISKEWIKRLREFSDQLYDSYFSSSPGLKDIEALGEDTKIYTFGNLIDMDKFWNKVVGGWFIEDRDIEGQKLYVQQFGHMWPVLGQMEEETAILDVMKKHNILFYTLTNGDTPLDRWCKRYYEGLGFFYTTNKEGRREDNNKCFSIYGDRIIQVIYPDDLIEEIDSVYDDAKDFESLDAPKLIRVLRKKADIEVTVMKNPLVAEELRKSVLRHFDR